MPYLGSFFESGSYTLTSWLFLRLLGVVYFIAFASFYPQITGLVGTNGILPHQNLLAAAKQTYGSRAYWHLPTLSWFTQSDGFLKGFVLAGMLGSLWLMSGFYPVPALLLLWVLYLSLFSVGQDFLSFQWDILLLEAGFLAIFLPLAPNLTVWLFRWLLFRLMFLSGVVKLASGDPSWRNLTAMSYHYLTQPLPTAFAWYAHKFSLGTHKLETLTTFFAELVVPFSFFWPRLLRLLGGALTIGLQLLIFVTGNYTFFNILTVALTLFLFDDTFFRGVLPGRLIAFAEYSGTASLGFGAVIGKYLVPLLAFLIVGVSMLQIGAALTRRMPALGQRLMRLVAPLHIVNSYGLFAVMTTVRNEIVIEGSRDGETWYEYEFKYKPGDISRAPRWAQPHQPRLDWQMWFAALSTYGETPWFQNFIFRLLTGEPAVLKLLEKNPFPDAPPTYIRALLYEYRFSDPTSRWLKKTWWERDLRGLYLPPVSLK